MIRRKQLIPSFFLNIFVCLVLACLAGKVFAELLTYRGFPVYPADKAAEFTQQSLSKFSVKLINESEYNQALFYYDARPMSVTEQMGWQSVGTDFAGMGTDRHFVFIKAGSDLAQKVEISLSKNVRRSSYSRKKKYFATLTYNFTQLGTENLTADEADRWFR